MDYLTKMLMAVAILFASTMSFSEDTPSNEQLFEMFKQSQARMAELEARTLKAETEAASAKTELAQLQIQTTNVFYETDTPTEQKSASGLLGSNANYSYKVLDHSLRTNAKQRYQLEAIRDGVLEQKLTFGGQVTALVNYQKSNTNTKFGWLMRHPTSANQIGESVSEAIIHSSNLAVTARLTNNLTAYAELLYNPEQNFASGSTITGLPRNNVNMRRAYLMYGNLADSNFYASIGKMDIPFGRNDTVSPFTNSTNWHSFAGLAYGGLIGYAGDKLHFRAMGIQGGAGFRNANTPVSGTNVPSKLNNFAVDANYTFSLDNEGRLLVGASYQYGSSYCQEYPVKHFNPCTDNNDAVAVYAEYVHKKLTLIAEAAQTLEVWPGSANPNFPAYADFVPEKNLTFTLGGKYATDFGLEQPVSLSAEFSRFEAGAKGSPWEKQDQYVLGASYFPVDSVKFFAEYVHVAGWVPLNFLSGGNRDAVNAFPNVPALHESWSDQDTTTDVVVIGVQGAF
jgi:hypothetical protein